MSEENKDLVPTSKDRYFAAIEELNPGALLPQTLTPEQYEKVIRDLQPSKIKTGFLASIPMLCRGPTCPISSICPLQQQNQAPIGERCPYETAFVEQFFHVICEELGVDETSMVEVSMVREYVDQEIQTQRKSNVLALEDFIINNVVGVNNKGEVLYRKELHPAIALEERLHRRKVELRKELLATRESKAKHLQNQQPTQVADLLAHYEQTKKRLEQRDKQQIIDIEPEED